MIVIQCAHCGTAMPEGKLFCINCGKSLHDATAITAAGTTGAPVFTPPSYSPAQADSDTEMGSSSAPEAPKTDGGEPRQAPDASPYHSAPETPQPGSGGSDNPSGTSPYRNYTPPAFASGSKDSRASSIGVGMWIGIFLVLCIPVANVVCTIIWACSAQRQSLKNFARAIIICWLVCLILAVLVGILLSFSGISMADFFYRYLTLYQ